MSRHGEILESFRLIVDEFDFNNAEHVTSLKKILIKCCDISNEVRPMDVSGPWVECLLEEYFHQVSPNCRSDSRFCIVHINVLIDMAGGEREDGRSTSGAFYGQGQSDESYGSNRIHTVCFIASL